MITRNEKYRRMALRRDIGNRVHKPATVAQTNGVGYLNAYACFTCKKSFKKPALYNGAIKCPDCAEPMCAMGRSFKAPRKSDLRQWEKVQKLWENGFRFFSYRSFPDAEQLPEKLNEVDGFIARNPDHPFKVKS